MASFFTAPSGLRAVWGLLVFVGTATFLVFLLFFALPLNWLPGYQDSKDFRMFLGEAKLLLVVFSSTALMGLIERRSVWAYGLGAPRAAQRFLSGVFWGSALLSVLIGSLIATGHLAIEGPVLDGYGVVTYGAIWAIAFVIVALAEEMLFRGYLQATLGRIFGFWTAAIMLSIAFGCVHLSNPGESMLAAINTAVVGVVFSLCLRLSGSLWWGIGFHAAWDWAQGFLFGAPVSGYLIRDHLLQYQPTGDPLWTGGAAGPEASALVLPVLALATIVIVISFGRARLLPFVRHIRSL